MTSPRLLARIVAGVAAGGVVLGFSALPVGSQVVPANPLVVEGSVECQVLDGDYTWVVEYTARNNYVPESVPTDVPLALGDIEIVSAEVSLDGEVVGSVEFDPNPVPAGEAAIGGVEIPGSVTGYLGLTVTWTAPTVDGGGVSTTPDAILDGTCAAPAETTTTTSAPAVQADAVVAAPTFTG